MKAILGVALICQCMNKTKPRRSVGYVHIPVAQHFSGKEGSKSQGSSPLFKKNPEGNYKLALLSILVKHHLVVLIKPPFSFRCRQDCSAFNPGAFSLPYGAPSAQNAAGLPAEFLVIHPAWAGQNTEKGNKDCNTCQI
ncbi:hypothetical protein [Desulfofundulus salinus]|uniref:hypothetical protein n=1 Tax=Desulfofundulus salinus TaxID=2419843 RepID=UPI001FAA250D|nr:hypothetical protein [Desulfofundulus salinum]